MPVELELERKVTITSGAGAGAEYSVTKLQLDTIYDHAMHMPDPGRILQPLAWGALGAAITAAVEAYNSEAGSEHRHIYVVVAVAAAIVFAATLFADSKIKRQGHRHARWLMRYMDGIYAECGLKPPEGPPGLGAGWGTESERSFADDPQRRRTGKARSRLRRSAGETFRTARPPWRPCTANA